MTAYHLHTKPLSFQNYQAPLKNFNEAPLICIVLLPLFRVTLRFERVFRQTLYNLLPTCVLTHATHVSGCQNHGPLLGPLATRCRIMVRTQKGTIILTTTHVTAIAFERQLGEFTRRSKTQSARPSAAAPGPPNG